jgi:hypothetical protein
MSRVISAESPPPSTFRPTIPRALDAIVMKAVERDAERRFQSAEELAVALEEDVTVASPHLVKTWFGPLASPELAQRAELIRMINKRFGTPGRSTPHPNALADEARAALAAVEAEGGQRRSWRTDGGLPAPSQSGKYPIDAIPTLKPVTRTLPPRRTRAARSGAELEGATTTGSNTIGSHVADIEESDPFEPRRLWWLSGRNVAGALLILVGLMATWVTAIGWYDQPPTSEHLRARRAAQSHAGAGASGYPNAPASERTLDTASLPAPRERADKSAASARPNSEAPRPRAKPAERQNAPAAPGLELRLSR